MAIADHVARFDPQLTLDVSTPVPASGRDAFRLPPEPPTHAELVAAALANEYVLAFIAEGMLTWSTGRVERNPPCYLVYEHGEVVGNVDDLGAMIRHAEKRRGLGRRLGIRALQPDDEVLPYNIGLRRAPTHPRRYRYEQRMALKSLLAPTDRRVVGWAMQRTRGEFLKKARAEPGLAARIADTTGLTLKAFWRAARGRGTHAPPPDADTD